MDLVRRIVSQARRGPDCKTQRVRFAEDVLACRNSIANGRDD
jgi:hypothetical protein